MERNTFLRTGAAGALEFLSAHTPRVASGGMLTSQQAVRSNSRTVSPNRVKGKPLGTLSDNLTRYAGNWNDTQLRHLLRRTMAGVPEKQFQDAQALGTMDAIVTKLLACHDTSAVPLPATLAPWVTDFPDYKDATTNAEQINVATLEFYKIAEIENWWFDQMMQEDLSIRQKMTLMWTNHFVTGSQTIGIAAYVYQYLVTCMTNALGNFKDFTSAISIDPAMLVYLNGNQNFMFNGEPFVNENYARELMELFTLGLFDPKTGKANYTETDIQNSARALTGWMPTTTAPFIGQFNPSLHDTGTKQFLGQSGNLALSDIINIIFDQGTPTGYTAAYWACQKMYQEFVYYVPNTSVIDAMAQLMLKNEFAIAPVMQALLSSAHFYDDSVIGAQIKSPVQYIGTLVREFAMTYPAFDPTEPPVISTDATGINTYNDPNPTLTLLTAICNQQGQELLNPPNVKGWPGGETWLSAGSFENRELYSAYMTGDLLDGKTINGVTYNLAFRPAQYTSQIPSSSTMNEGQLFLALETVSLPVALGPNESGSLARDPSATNDLNDNAVPTFAPALTQLPEFQLY